MCQINIEVLFFSIVVIIIFIIIIKKIIKAIELETH